MKKILFIALVLIGFQSFGQADKILTRNGTTIDTATTLESQARAVNRAAAVTAKVLADSLDQATARMSADLIRQQITNRSYEAIVKVTTTISAALTSITDASSIKRYLLYIPNGTYTETNILTKPFVDMQGENMDSVIVNANSGTTDLMFLSSGSSILVSNMTLNQTNNIGDAGVNKYPIHADISTSGNTVTTIFYRVKANALGTNSKSGIGIGLYLRQRMYLVDCEFTSQVGTGIFVHNQASGSVSNHMELMIVNTKSTGATEGLLVQNGGSLATGDRVCIFGGSLSGGNYDIRTSNTTGSGETYVMVDPYVKYTTTSFVDASRFLKNSLTSFPLQTDYNFFSSSYPSLEVEGAAAGTNFNGIMIRNKSASTGNSTADLNFATFFNESNTTTGAGAKISVINTNAGTGGNAMRFYTKTAAAALTEKMRISSEGLVGIGTTSANSTLHIAGSFARTYTVSAIDITLTVAHSVVGLTATTRIATLPTAVGITGREYTIKLTASGTGTVATTASQTIDGATTYSLSAQYKYVTVQSDGANWIIIGNN